METIIEEENIIEIYNLNKYKLKDVKYLEIGAKKGKHLRSIKENINNIKIVGIDINPCSILYENKKEEIYIEIGNQNDNIFLEKINNKYGPFDIIIDKGSKKKEDIIKTFEILYPKINNDGIYIIKNGNNIFELINYKEKMFNNIKYEYNEIIFKKNIIILKKN